MSRCGKSYFAGGGCEGSAARTQGNKNWLHIMKFTSGVRRAAGDIISGHNRGESAKRYKATQLTARTGKVLCRRGH